MNAERHECEKALTQECFAKYPDWARKAFIIRLLNLFLPPEASKRLPKLPKIPGIGPPPGWDPSMGWDPNWGSPPQWWLDQYFGGTMEPWMLDWWMNNRGNLQGGISPPTEPQWYEYYDDNFWEWNPAAEPETVWDPVNDWWFCDLPVFPIVENLQLQVVGTWFESFRPTKFKCQLLDTPAGGRNIRLSDSEGNLIATANNYVDDTELVCDFSAGYDIARFAISTAMVDFQKATAMQFYG